MMRLNKRLSIGIAALCLILAGVVGVSFALFKEDIPKEPVIVDLSSYYNNDGFSNSSKISDGDYDRGGATYSADAVKPDPDFEGVPYKLGPTEDKSTNAISCDGQTITLPEGRYASLRFLGSATNNDQTGIFTINYSDGTRTDLSILLKDWCAKDIGNQKIIQTMDFRNTPNGKHMIKTSIFGYYLKPSSTKKVIGITLPKNINIHVLAMTLIPAGSSLDQTEEKLQYPVSGLDLWLKADEGVVLNKSRVTQWDDQSGKGNDLIQEKEELQPEYIIDGINGKPSIKFDGMDDQMVKKLSKTYSGNSTVIMVLKQNSKKGSIFATDTSDTKGALEFAADSKGTGTLNAIDRKGNFASLTDEYADKYTLLVVQIDSETGNIKSFQDGMLVSDITDEKFKDYKKYIRYVLGGGFNKEYLSAELAEIMVCREVIDDTSRQQVEKYLNEKYGIYTPQMSIPNIGLNLWLKADSGVIQNDAMVSTWEDQSGNGNNVAQNVAEKQPVLVANALRGKPAVRFDGEDDELLKKLSKAYSGSSTIALVMKQTTSGQGENRGFLSTGDKSVVNSFEIAGDKNGTGVLEARNSNGSSTAISDSKTEEYVKLVVTIDAHKGSIKAYQDGKLISDKTDTSYKSFNEVAGYILGKGQDNRHLSVEIAELMFYRKVLSGEDRKMIEEYLNEKYSGEVTPVSTKDLDLWLRADKGVRMNGEFVSQWADQSGHYNDVIQDDAELQPKLVNDGINGKAVVRFDGKDDFLLKELSKEYKGSSTIIMVMKQNMLGQGQNKGVFGTNTWKPNDEPGAFSITGGWAGDGVMTLVDSSAQSNVLSVTDARSDSYFVVSIKVNSDTGNVKAYKNGVLISEKTSDAFKNFNTFTKYYLGRGYWANFLSCDLAEMLIYRRAIEDIEIQQAEQYLNDKYKIYNPIAVDGLDLWLKADTGITLDGTKVSKWSDQSGSGNDVEQSEKNRQPEIIKDAVNGKSVIRFDGLDDELLKELEKPHVGSSSILIVLKQRIDQEGSKGIFATDTVGSEGAYGIASHKENKGMLAAQAANNGIVQISDNKTLSYRVLSITADPKKGSLKAYENGKLTASVTDDNIKGFNKISKYVLGRIFDGGNLSADIAEIIVYNRAINDDERKLAEKYLNSRYLIYIPEPDISKEKQELGIPTAAMNLWVRADYGVKTKGNAVVRWEDLSGNGNDLVQPDKKMQPILVEGAINEKQAVKFDGIDDELSKVLNGTYTGNSSIFMVLKQTADVNKGRSIFATSSKGQKGAVEIGYGSESGALAVFNSENQKVLVRAGDKGRESYMTLGTFIETNTGNISIYENGSLISSKTEDNLKQCNAFEKYILGKGAYGKNAGAEIAELMVFRRVLTNSERMQVENYFNKKYSVYTQPPELKADNDIKAAVAKAPVPEGYLSIADYGAKADDSGDDLEAINKCINDAAKNKKGVYIPEGTFEYSDLFTLDGLNMIGAGKDKSFLHSTSLDRQAVKLTGTNAGISGCRLTTVKPKQRLMNEQSARIYVLGASNFTISDVFIDGGSSAGIFISDSTKGIIKGNHIKDTMADAIHNTNKSSFITVEGNTVRNNGDDMVAVVSYQKDGGLCHNIIIRNNDVAGNYWGRGITVVGGYNVAIENNLISDTAFAGIYISGESAFSTYGVQNVGVIGNTLYRCGSSVAEGGHGSLHVFADSAACTGIYFMKNKVYDSKCMGVHLNGGMEQRVEFNSNIFVNTAKEGVYMDTTFRGNAKFTNNSFTNTEAYALRYHKPVSGTLEMEGNTFKDINYANKNDLNFVNDNLTNDVIKIEEGNMEKIIIRNNNYTNTAGFKMQYFIREEVKAAEENYTDNNTDTLKSYINGK